LQAGLGAVFEILKTAGGYASTPTVLFNFDGTHGASPTGSLIADASGNLFGTTNYGGTSDQGTVFEIVKTASGYATTPIILVSFDGANGQVPFAGLLADANGNLFGTTGYGGSSNLGVVFEIVKTASGYAGTPTILYNFDGAHGANPYAGLIADANGNLFGTTAYGGANQAYATFFGTVFEIEKTASGYASTPTVLWNCDWDHGFNPYGGLIADANGNLFGTASDGGAYRGGTVFEIVKTASGYASTPITLVSFDGTIGYSPYASLLTDANGNLFGTTEYGGHFIAGGVFEIVKTAGGYASIPTALVIFDGTQGANPWAGLIADANGNLFGTTPSGGANGGGTVFELSGAGFVPPLRFAGVPGTSNCNGVSTSTLARTYGGIAAAAKALGYSSVAALQSAIAAHCGN